MSTNMNTDTNNITSKQFCSFLSQSSPSLLRVMSSRPIYPNASPENSENPENPENPENQKDSENPENPENPENQKDSENPENQKDSENPENQKDPENQKVIRQESQKKSLPYFISNKYKKKLYSSTDN